MVDLFAPLNEEECMNREDYTTPELTEYPPLTDVTGGSGEDMTG